MTFQAYLFDFYFIFIKFLFIFCRYKWQVNKGDRQVDKNELLEGKRKKSSSSVSRFHRKKKEKSIDQILLLSGKIQDPLQESIEIFYTAHSY